MSLSLGQDIQAVRAAETCPCQSVLEFGKFCWSCGTLQSDKVAAGSAPMTEVELIWVRVDRILQRQIAGSKRQRTLDVWLNSR